MTESCLRRVSRSPCQETTEVQKAPFQFPPIRSVLGLSQHPLLDLVGGFGAPPRRLFYHGSLEKLAIVLQSAHVVPGGGGVVWDTLSRTPSTPRETRGEPQRPQPALSYALWDSCPAGGGGEAAGSGRTLRGRPGVGWGRVAPHTGKAPGVRLRVLKTLAVVWRHRGAKVEEGGSLGTRAALCKRVGGVPRSSPGNGFAPLGGPPLELLFKAVGGAV